MKTHTRVVSVLLVAVLLGGPLATLAGAQQPAQPPAPAAQPPAPAGSDRVGARREPAPWPPTPQNEQRHLSLIRPEISQFRINIAIEAHAAAANQLNIGGRPLNNNSGRHRNSRCRSIPQRRATADSDSNLASVTVYC